MHDRFFVICGTHQEFRTFTTRKASEMWNEGNTHISLSNFVWVSDATRLKGVSNPHGWFVGTWRENENILEILVTLKTQYHTQIPKSVIDACNEILQS